MAKLTFYGATEGVTGSAYLLETGQATILLECGLFQGSREEEKANAKPFPFDIRKLDAVVETLEELENIIVEASENGVNILIPSFAVDRTQEIIFRLNDEF